MGKDRYMYRVDEDPEVRTGTVSASCPEGEYTVEASMSSPGGSELASATADFTVAAPTPEPPAEPTPTPTASIALAPSDAVEEGNEITATMSFGGLTSDADASTRDYTFLADVLDADDCEGGGLGVDRNINRVDEDPEVRTGTVSAGCPAGAYTLRVSLSSTDNTEMASASAGFFILRAPVVIEPPTLTALSVSHGNPAVDVALSPVFGSETLEYRAAVRVERVAIAPTAGDADAGIAYLDGNGDAIADADSKADGQQVDLAAGSNTVKVAVSKDGLTTTYTLSLFRLVMQQQQQTTAVTGLEITSTPAADYAETGEPYHPTGVIYGPPRTLTENSVERTISGETLEVTVTFSQAVTVTTPDDSDGNPQIPSLEIDVGGTGRQALYDRDSGSAELVFAYSVQTGDFDFDGFAVKANKLTLNGGAIAAAGTAADLGHAAIGSDDEHRVGDIPRITHYELRDVPEDRTYGLNDEINLVVCFSVNVNAPGGNNAARFYVDVGGTEKQLTHTGVYQDRLFYKREFVTPDDYDEDGISFRVNAFRGNRFFNKDNGGQAIFLGFPAWRPPGDPVVADGRRVAVTDARVVSSPASGDTYRGGEPITVQVTVDSPTLVTCVPHLELDVGGARRTAAYVGSPAPERMLFSYVAGSGGADFDDDGVELVADSLSTAGPTDRSSAIIISGVNPPFLAHQGLQAQAGHKVDAGLRVTAVTVTSSPSGSEYAAGDNIDVALTFSGAVQVSGAPEIRLGIDSAERTAVYSAGSGSARVVFSYTVVADDYDADGIAVHGEDGRISLPSSAGGHLDRAEQVEIRHQSDGHGHGDVQQRGGRDRDAGAQAERGRRREGRRVQLRDRLEPTRVQLHGRGRRHRPRRAEHRRQQAVAQRRLHQSLRRDHRRQPEPRGPRQPTTAPGRRRAGGDETVRAQLAPQRRHLSPSRLLNKGVHVRHRRVQVVGAWVLLEEIVPRSRGAFSPFGFADRPSWGSGHR